MFDITPIVGAVFALIATAITTYLIPWIKSRTTAQQQREINAWVKIAVTAAEQIYNGPGQGKDKKLYVVRWLTEHGIAVDMGKIDLMIESAVYEMKTGLVIYEGAGIVGGDSDELS